MSCRVCWQLRNSSWADDPTLPLENDIIGKFLVSEGLKVSATLRRGARTDVPWSGAVNIPDWKLFPSSFQSDVCCTWLRSDNCRRKSCRKYIWIVFK